MEDKSYYLSIEIPKALYDKAFEVTDDVRDTDKPKRYRVKKLVSLILELTDFSLDYSYTEPLRLAKAGAFNIGIAQVGMRSSRTAIDAVASRIMKNMSEEQLDVISDYIVEMLMESE